MRRRLRAAVELASAEAPHWDKIAARLRYLDFARHLAESEAKRGITNFVAKLRYLTAKELYGSYILENYTEQELRAASRFIVAERNHLYSYAGLDLLLSRYVIHTHHGVALESPQEMYLGIALHLAMLEEPSVRMDWVRRFYDMLSLAAGHDGDADTRQREKAVSPALELLHRHGAGLSRRHLPQPRLVCQGQQVGRRHGPLLRQGPRDRRGHPRLRGRGGRCHPLDPPRQ